MLSCNARVPRLELLLCHVTCTRTRGALLTLSSSPFHWPLVVACRYSWLPNQSGPPLPDAGPVTQQPGAGATGPASSTASNVDAGFVWNLLLCVVTGCVLLQLWLWSMYTLKGDNLRTVKRKAKAQLESPVARGDRDASA